MKKLIMFLLCMGMCVMTVCAAGKASPLGRVICDLMPDAGSIPLVDGKGGMDWFQCKSNALEQKVDPYYIVNIYALADIQGSDGMLYERAQDTQHHTKKASALTNKAYRKWNASPANYNRKCNSRRKRPTGRQQSGRIRESIKTYHQRRPSCELPPS